MVREAWYVRREPRSVWPEAWSVSIRTTFRPSRLTPLTIMLLLASLGCRGRAAYEGKSVHQLIQMLHDPRPPVQVRGAYGLSLHGTAAKDSVPDLIEALSRDPLVRQNAALALGQIGPEAKEAVPALTTALRDSEWSVRRQSAIALGQIGADAAKALPALEKLTKEKDHLVARAARDAVKQIRKQGALKGSGQY